MSAIPVVAKNVPFSHHSSSGFPVPVHHEQSAFAPMQHYFNQLCAGFMNGRGIFSLWQGNRFWPESSFSLMEPALDISETGKAFAIRVELPGMEEKDIDISINNHYLTLKGRKQEEFHEEDENTLLRERSYGAFQRVLQLPETANAERAKAYFKNGVLTVELPKTAKATKEMRKLDIEHAA
jgi:HSP20 family protein